MNQKGFINVAVLIVILLVAGGIGYFVLTKKSTPNDRAPDKTTVKTSSELRNIPVYVGEMVFNERNNDGFDKDQIVNWTSSDLQVTSNGKVSGTVKTSYQGPEVPYPVFKDILFVQVRADYIDLGFGDISHYPLGDVIPVAAQQSRETSATFSLKSSFRIPELARTGSLSKVWINLTWVRVYQQNGAYYFHVFAGDAGRYLPNVASLEFDARPKEISGRFAYHQVLPKNSLGGGDFDYVNWLRNNILK